MNGTGKDTIIGGCLVHLHRHQALSTGHSTAMRHTVSLMQLLIHGGARMANLRQPF
jgi:hypothetical protein